MDLSDFRRIEPLPGFNLPTNDPGMAPEIKYLTPDQLVVNDEYQRELSRASLKQIKKMAQNWDWSSFKAPSVARTDDERYFEVVDGQHTAIAAATNGNVPFIPCVVMEAATLKDKASGFLGINKDRLALTQAAIYAAEVAAQDDIAIAVECAMQATGTRLLAVPPTKGVYKVGETMAIGTMKAIVQKRGEARLTRILKIASEAQSAPIGAALIKALDLALPLEEASDIDNRLMVTLRSQGANRLELISKNRTPPGGKTYETLADSLAEMAKLPDKRLGHSSKNKKKK